jgi:hypothetical protein
MTDRIVHAPSYNTRQALVVLSTVAAVLVTDGVRGALGADGSFAYFDPSGRYFYWALGVSVAAVWKRAKPLTPFSRAIWVSGLSWFYWLVVEPSLLRRLVGDGAVDAVAYRFGSGSLFYSLYFGHAYRVLPYLLIGHCVLVIALGISSPRERPAG